MWTFKAYYKPTIWGGDELLAFKGETSRQMKETSQKIGESWELSDVRDHESVVDAGVDAGLTLSQLVEKYGSSLLGDNNSRLFGNHFPLLIKFIGASDKLSVQVHPDDELAHELGHSNGKNEMWVVLGSDPGSELYNGFIHPVDPADFNRMVDDGSIMNELRAMEVQPGDAFYIPAGRVHSIGKGLILAEIQQTSDDTFRIYDYHRKDANGNERELHIDLARRAVNFNDDKGQPIDYSRFRNQANRIIATPYFTTNWLAIDKDLSRDYSEIDSFVIYMALEGEGLVSCSGEGIEIKKGRTLLLGAKENLVTVKPVTPVFRFLEIYLYRQAEKV